MEIVEIVRARCCGIDVHQKLVVACVLLTQADGSVDRRVRRFGTMTADLLALADWLRAWDVRVVALESTGIYWRPIFNVLEDDGEVTLVNAQPLLKRAPRHKSDVLDAEWLADRLRHGLVQASFIPPAPIRELRELTRLLRPGGPSAARTPPRQTPPTVGVRRLPHSGRRRLAPDVPRGSSEEVRVSSLADRRAADQRRARDARRQQRRSPCAA